MKNTTFWVFFLVCWYISADEIMCNYKDPVYAYYISNMKKILNETAL
jgi:hypothetical protein